MRAALLPMTALALALSLPSCRDSETAETNVAAENAGNAMIAVANQAGNLEANETLAQPEAEPGAPADPKPSVAPQPAPAKPPAVQARPKPAPKPVAPPPPPPPPTCAPEHRAAGHC